MPIWLELTILLLLTYVTGFAIGWAIWGRTPSPETPVPTGRIQDE